MCVNSAKSTIKFLGTAGARFVVTKQLRASGGIWFTLEGTEFLVDPGPGTLVNALAACPKKNPANLSGILLSHRHLDHSNDLNIMVEAMTEGGRVKRGEIFLPEDALNNKDPIFFSYLHKTVKSINVLHEKHTYQFQNLTFETSPLHDHGTKTYGFKFITSSGTIAHITDTKYFEEMLTFYKADILIINVVCCDYSIKKNNIEEIKHIFFPEVIKIVEEVRPKLAILTHFGLNMLSENPNKKAAELTKKTGITVIAAEDGMEINVDAYL
ncbi:MBL fold metallo-hydrolase [Candidatus Desantisbacteria bacterium]|nr:MBL fold metallo-hydrolase [Candidatus Desantisbacteria bacterium]